jgi:hypothetical protein
MTHIAWTSIDQFHNVRRTFAALNPEGGHTATYRAKVKLHGTNAAVQVTPEGVLECQSRERLITPEDDNSGFARWVYSRKEEWLKALSPGTVVFGEWAGPGIMKGVALNKIPEKVFAVFAVLQIGEVNALSVEPAEIQSLVQGAPCHVLPWYEGLNVTVDWDATPEALAPVLDTINAAVRAVEVCDPWVKAIFGVEGTGEGLVFYPTVGETGQTAIDAYYLRMFKAKGEDHKTVAQKAPAQADPEVAKNLTDFAALVLTDSRLEQGATAVKPDGATMGYDMKRIGAFLGWVSKDVAKECGPELTASGLDAKAASKAVTEFARKWYMTKIAAE